MTIVGEQAGGDPRLISLVQAVRILVVVFSVPLYLRFVEGLELPTGAQRAAGVPVANPLELVILACCAGAGYFAARWLRIPAAQLIGPLTLSAAAYLTGIVEGRPPFLVIAIAQLIIGSSISARFTGLDLTRVGRIILLAFGLAFGMLIFAVVGSGLLAAPLGLDRTALLLAPSPGGLPEMTMIGLSLNVDTAFVSTMHVIRIILIVVLAPLLFRLLGWGRAPAGGP